MEEKPICFGKITKTIIFNIKCNYNNNNNNNAHAEMWVTEASGGKGRKL